MMYKRICKHIDLNAAREEELIVDWYPLHSTDWLRILRPIWGSRRQFRDFTFVQPIAQLRDYFGARVAFLFIWNGLHCKLLLALWPLALLAELVAASAWQFLS